MIALTAVLCKGRSASLMVEICRHGNVSRILLPPNFGPSGALLDCDKKILRRVRFFRSRIPQPPAPRGRWDRTLRRKLIPTGPTQVGPFLFGGCTLLFPGRDVVSKGDESANPADRLEHDTSDTVLRQAGPWCDAGSITSRFRGRAQLSLRSPPLDTPVGVSGNDEIVDDERLQLLQRRIGCAAHRAGLVARAVLHIDDGGIDAIP